MCHFSKIWKEVHPCRPNHRAAKDAPFIIYIIRKKMFLFMKQIVSNNFTLYIAPVLIVSYPIYCYHCKMK